ncbi:MAG TPA: ribosome recycling factor [Desulfobacteraceae bacterium]|nr:ribosome recycling factor [Desulfobacteraceae bacterium]
MKDEIIADMKARMDKTMSNLKKEFMKLRTGRATPALLEGIKVECYGTTMPLEQVASISVPESRLLVIKPWDKNILPDIEKAILRSDLGLTPQDDGKLIRIAIPALSEERRRELAKIAKKMAEGSKIAIRNIRRDTNDFFKDLKKNKEIPEDDMYRALDEVQKVTDEYIEKLDDALDEKIKEIMEF